MLLQFWLCSSSDISCVCTMRWNCDLPCCVFVPWPIDLRLISYVTSFSNMYDQGWTERTEMKKEVISECSGRNLTLWILPAILLYSGPWVRVRRYLDMFLWSWLNINGSSTLTRGVSDKRPWRESEKTGKTRTFEGWLEPFVWLAYELLVQHKGVQDSIRDLTVRSLPCPLVPGCCFFSICVLFSGWGHEQSSGWVENLNKENEWL